MSTAPHLAQPLAFIALCEITRSRALNLAHQKLSVLPDFIANFSWLQYLDLRNNQLKQLPSALASLSGLTVIHLEENLFKQDPSIWTIEKLPLPPSLLLCNSLPICTFHLTPAQAPDRIKSAVREFAAREISDWQINRLYALAQDMMRANAPYKKPRSIYFIPRSLIALPRPRNRLTSCFLLSNKEDEHCRCGMGGSKIVKQVLCMERAEIFALLRTRLRETVSASILQAEMQNETSILQSLQGKPHTLMLRTACATLFPKHHTYLVLEKLTHGNLFHYIQKNKLQTTEKIYIAEQICRSVDDLHQIHFIHRDLKLDNFGISIKNGEIRIFLLDFGLACNISRINRKDIRWADARTIAPEGIEGYLRDDWEKIQAAMTPAADIFALAHVLYEICFTRNPPFAFRSYSPRTRLLTQQSYFGNPNWVTETCARINPLLRPIFEGMLQPDPLRRWTARQAADALSHLYRQLTAQ